ncbi:MAG: recombinase family protein [Treponema sp.]|nr:recombinase family protein [Treponema sp.]
MVYGYIRVSTEKQTAKNQKIEIRRFCKVKKLHKVQWISETISGTKSPDKRKLGVLLQTVNKDDIIVCTEISRLGRSMLMIFDILNKLMTIGAKVYTIKENYELGDNIQSQVLAFAFGLSAQIERDLISERTKMGLERIRKEGKIVGCPKGRKHSKLKLSGKCAYIKRERLKGRTKKSLALELGVSFPTIYSFMKMKGIA